MRGLALASKIVVAGLAGAFLTVSAVRAEPARPASDHDAFRDAPVGAPSAPPSAPPSARPSARPSTPPAVPPSPAPGLSGRP
ncbi:hypothetical protein Slala03_66910 [Streptomyces lavendulae subsp. lavendulae]|uniref:hypothetical protein n=1 Tax=Streptomyces lavendulae TaxID=1914 RepID=UPI0024A39395|nr:hypothetical protein [Streptomyces lavendulae]GLV87002.1 hypothetical protein Slala03_66910 [Streptomyces lavendulae subsp. lavendulae]